MQVQLKFGEIKNHYFGWSLTIKFLTLHYYQYPYFLFLKEGEKNIDIMNKEEWLKKGYVTEPVDKTLDLKTEI